MPVHPARLLMLALAAACLLAPGCVTGHVTTLVKYDKEADSFKVLRVYSNVCIDEKKEKQKKELDHLAAMYKKRDSLLFLPAEFELFDAPAYERTAKHQYRKLSLTGPPDKEPAAEETPIDLDSIRIIPGELYLNAHGNLCYHHQLVVPGKAADAWAAGMGRSINAKVAEMVEDDAEAEKTKGLKRPTWEQFRKQQIDALVPKAPGDKPAEESLLPFEAASLAKLRTAVADKSVKLTRTRDEFTLTVPLTKKDSEELIATADAIQKAARQRLKEGKPVEGYWHELLALLRMKYAEGAGLEVRVNFPEALNGMAELNPQPVKDREKLYRSTVEGLRERGIKVKERGTEAPPFADYGKAAP